MIDKPQGAGALPACASSTERSNTGGSSTCPHAHGRYQRSGCGGRFCSLNRFTSPAKCGAARLSQVRRRRLTGWLLVTAAGVFSGGTVALATWWLPAALASGLAATTTAVAGVWLARGTQLVAVPGVRVPLVRDLDDPVALGVHRAAGRSAPVFIARDVTERLHEVLRRDRFVPIVGESTAGKTRLAYETVRALLPATGSWSLHRAHRDSTR